MIGKKCAIVFAAGVASAALATASPANAAGGWAAIAYSPATGAIGTSFATPSTFGRVTSARDPRSFMLGGRLQF